MGILLLTMTSKPLENLNPKEDGVRFGHSVGTKKRNELMKVILEKKFKIFNARVSQNAS